MWATEESSEDQLKHTCRLLFLSDKGIKFLKFFHNHFWSFFVLHVSHIESSTKWCTLEISHVELEQIMKIPGSCWCFLWGTFSSWACLLMNTNDQQTSCTFTYGFKASHWVHCCNNSAPPRCEIWPAGEKNKACEQGSPLFIFGSIQSPANIFLKEIMKRTPLSMSGDPMAKFGSFGAFPKDVWVLIFRQMPITDMHKVATLNKQISRLAKASYESKYKRRLNLANSAQLRPTVSTWNAGTIDALAFWKNKRLIIRGSKEGRSTSVAMIDDDGNELFNFSSLVPKQDRAREEYLHELLVVNDALLIVCHSTRNCVHILERKHKTKKWVLRNSLTGNLNYPWGCCVDPLDTNIIYVADT